MIIVYILLIVFTTHVLSNAGLLMQSGELPYFGTKTFCHIIHILILITSIWYFGWIGGIIVFVLCLFSIFELFVGWILSIPGWIFINSKEKWESYINIKATLIGYLPIILALFMISSFFIVDFQCILNELHFSNTTWIAIAVALLICCIARSVVQKITFKCNDFLH